MIKILLCCGGGFSSSALCSKLHKEILENNMENDYSIEFSSFDLAKNKISEFDILVCCPHLKYDAVNMIKTLKPTKPIYILPPKMYGRINFKELAFDVIDAIDLYNKTQKNPVSFPGEENTLKITRYVAYRNSNL
ncbi:Phosphotransferase system cellobiose-specific component IIB [Clostridium cavendishii DSM 21758]|uniref:Phosphotransferase system cellobiose-specific component IIB n=1 Tax=Clostridium cavendishii DSM 21758 TaxID=1121302 RepID=A0A1M6NLE8_9CLOT|nr:PTS sugar transporter subunit IIB [Clostridium cavendishii]SHJ96555.1 Phosphotransferase system cellobiose-specific component IIB [Clostridium cavendishii DSM 21758]